MERYRFSLLLVVCALVALGAKVPVGAAGAGVDTATLQKIPSRLDARTGVLNIEAGTTRRLAIFGESTWNHFSVTVSVSVLGAAAEIGAADPAR